MLYLSCCFRSFSVVIIQICIQANIYAHCSVSCSNSCNSILDIVDGRLFLICEPKLYCSSYCQVAIKYIKKTKIEDGNDLMRIRREIKILSSLRHEHIVNIREGKS